METLLYSHPCICGQLVYFFTKGETLVWSRVQHGDDPEVSLSEITPEEATARPDFVADVILEVTTDYIANRPFIDFNLAFDTVLSSNSRVYGKWIDKVHDYKGIKVEPANSYNQVFPRY